MIDLKDFVKDTLCQIAIGIDEASTELKKRKIGSARPVPLANSDPNKIAPITAKFQDNLGIALVSNGNILPVQFDIVVATNEGKTTKADAGVKVLGIGGKLKADYDEGKSYDNRLKFTVPLFIENNNHRK